MSLHILRLIAAPIMLATTTLTTLSALAQGCSLDKQKFSNVITQLHVAVNDEDKNQLLQKQSTGTAQAAEILRAGIVGILTKQEEEDPFDPVPLGKVTSYIQCVQDFPSYQSWDSIINTPRAFLSKETGQETLTVAYYIYRGPFPAGVPDTLPFVDFFIKKNRQWEFVGSTGSDYRSFTFQIDKISNGVPNQDWFLLSGFHIGDTGTRLMLETVGFDGRSIRIVWKLADLKHTTVEEIHKNYIILSQYEGFAGGQDIYQYTRWDVTAEGLKRKD